MSRNAIGQFQLSFHLEFGQVFPIAKKNLFAGQPINEKEYFLSYKSEPINIDIGCILHGVIHCFFARHQLNARASTCRFHIRP
jgi:hypothetical protein